MTIKSEWLATFLAVVDAGSFTEGARRIHRTQSAASMQIQQLEQQAGHPLLVRGQQTVLPTEAGERLIPYARRVVQSLADAAQVLDIAPEQGRLHVGIAEEYATSRLPELLAAFRRQQPRVELEVRCEPSAGIERALARGALDLGILIVDRQPVHGEVLRYDPTRWFIGEGLELEPGNPLPLVLFDHACWWRQWALDAVESSGQAWRIVYSSASVAGVASAIRAGVGIGVLGESTALPGTLQAPAALGLPPLPGSHLVLQVASPTAPGAKVMASQIRTGFSIP
ncbi:transcriptional regulator [Litchfieldella qijiaojingensis]|uniref:Transcriptional regulator n=1 Tax=Litchfieldella qijiaojingensis TaxID=980347 RepID=A0ABQ2YKY2_9GAMM|nr:LysR substrate-binding domain-containing protein [Halomonas qijiaojingensis]GGX87737.1 transcriptional regulator [Halomonas qijiaojingensis]